MNTNLHEDQFKFSGYTKSYLRFNKTGKEWRLTNYREEATTWAVTNGTDYPLGTRKWKIVSPSFSGLHEMNLNACNDTQYNCHDGGCIHINARHALFFILIPRVFAICPYFQMWQQFWLHWWFWWVRLWNSPYCIIIFVKRPPTSYRLQVIEEI